MTNCAFFASMSASGFLKESVDVVNALLRLDILKLVRISIFGPVMSVALAMSMYDFFPFHARQVNEMGRVVLVNFLH